MSTIMAVIMVIYVLALVPVTVIVLKSERKDRAQAQLANNAVDSRVAEAAAEPALPSLPLPNPLQLTTFELPKRAFTVSRRPLPRISQNVLHWLDNVDAVKKHIIFLDETRHRISSHYRDAVLLYEAAIAHITRQRKALVATVARADNLLTSVRGIRLEDRDIKRSTPYEIPQAPSYQSAESFIDTMNGAISGLGRGVGKVIGQQSSPAAIVAALIAGLAISVITFQKTVRRMVAADADIRAFAREARAQVNILERSLQEMHHYSHEIGRTDSALRERIDTFWTCEFRERYANGMYSATEKSSADEFVSLTMLAKTYVAMAN